MDPMVGKGKLNWPFATLFFKEKKKTHMQLFLNFLLPVKGLEIVDSVWPTIGSGLGIWKSFNGRQNYIQFFLPLATVPYLFKNMIFLSFLFPFKIKDPCLSVETWRQWNNTSAILFELWKKTTSRIRFSIN